MKHVAVRSKFLEKGGEPLYDSRNITICVTIYADAISLAIPACTIEKMYFVKESSEESQRRVKRREERM